MSKKAGLCGIALVLAAELAGSASTRDPQPTLTLLDRYLAGQFDAVVSELRAARDMTSIYNDLKTHGQAWIDADRGARDRRRLAAATFALEAARVGADSDWKEVRMFVRLENIFWRPPARLLEWGCQIMRRSPEPSEVEHAWQMAALSVVGHAQDFEFAIGSPWEARANPRDEILHLEHAIARFPGDPRLLLAQGIAAELRLFPNARNTGLKETREIFSKLKDNPEVGAEALMRLGVTDARAGDLSAARSSLSAAIARSHDSFVTYLSHLFLGHVRLHGKDTAGAALEYRRALAAVPRAQSATFALAALLGAQGARREAASLVDLSITAPLAVDPWRIYGDGEDRFWSERIERLRKEIRP